MENYKKYLETVNRANEIVFSKTGRMPYRVMSKEQFEENKRIEKAAESQNYDHSSIY
jgi:hypothetical protein